MNTYNEEEYPHVSSLGDGTYSGIQIKDGKVEDI